MLNFGLSLFISLFMASCCLLKVLRARCEMAISPEMKEKIIQRITSFQKIKYRVICEWF